MITIVKMMITMIMKTEAGEWQPASTPPHSLGIQTRIYLRPSVGDDHDHGGGHDYNDYDGDDGDDNDNDGDDANRRQICGKAGLCTAVDSAYINFPSFVRQQHFRMIIIIIMMAMLCVSFILEKNNAKV